MVAAAVGMLGAVEIVPALECDEIVVELRAGAEDAGRNRRRAAMLADDAGPAAVELLAAIEIAAPRRCSSSPTRSCRVSIQGAAIEQRERRHRGIERHFLAEIGDYRRRRLGVGVGVGVGGQPPVPV